jgi:hypothetical protein
VIRGVDRAESSVAIRARRSEKEAREAICPMGAKGIGKVLASSSAAISAETR